MDDLLEYPLRIVGPTPATIPMARLAQYMAEFARLMGCAETVHFKEIRDGSVNIVALAEPEQVATISPRIRDAVNNNDSDAAGPWRKLNELLAEDGWVAELPLPKSREVIKFPGKTRVTKAIRIVNQHTAVQGRLVRIEGAGDPVKVGLDIDGDLTARISISAAQAVQLSQYFHRHVRLSGEGRWRRDTDGRWFLDNLAATAFELLDDVPLGETLGKLREIMPPGSGEKIIKAVDELRRA